MFCSLKPAILSENPLSFDRTYRPDRYAGARVSSGGGILRMRTRRTNERPVNPEARSTFEARNGTRENDSARPRPFTLVNDIECGPHYRHYQWRTPLSCQSFGVDNREC